MIDCTEICPDLGACCRIFCATSNHKDDVRTLLSDEQHPFAEIGETDNCLILNCTALAPDGKCSQYDTRPTTCSQFQPYTDSLCCLFVGPPGPRAISVTHPELVAQYRHSNIPPSL
jgi:Fe-S-cluster containining protein